MREGKRRVFLRIVATTFTEMKWEHQRERAELREETARQLGHSSFEAYLRAATLTGMSIPQMAQETGLTNHHIREGMQDLLQRPQVPWQMDKSIRISQARKELGKSWTALERLIKSGRLPVWRTQGGHRRVRVADVRKFAEARIYG